MSSAHESNSNSNRRGFLKTTGAAVASISAMGSGPFVRASDKADAKPAIVGEGDHKYEATHGWGQVPDHISWHETHGVAVDEAGLIYIKHRSRGAQPMDTIAVFDPEGKFVRSFGKEYHGGGHGIDVRKEGGEEFLYLSDVAHNIVVKTNLKGEVVWSKSKPMESGKYDDPKARYSPTNVAFAPDGGFYIADGYGSNYIHQYDKAAKYVRTWGGTGDKPGEFKTPHGLWLDDRPGHDPAIVVADRANARMQYFTLDGKHIRTDGGVSFPAHFDIRGDVLLCPDLHARVSLFDKDNKVIAHLGYDPEWTKQALDGFKMRRDPSSWRSGRFVHPHDACFDKDGNIFVVEWVEIGRVTKLRRVG